ncbi:MAG: LON peptidase substrate-binding domain-containing protein [Xylophilus ampelinus]
MPAEPLRFDALPLFPLGTVLFPQGVLPLQIFEVRYLDMIRRCHAAGTPFGVVALTAGREVRQAGAPGEAFHGVGTLATIEALETVQPGLLRVRCAGTRRFSVSRREQLRHGLWTGDVACLPDDLPVPVPEDLRGVAEALRQLVATLEREEAAARRDAADLQPTAPQIARPHRLDDCGWVANRWAELLPLALDDRQRLMSLDNPLLRLELVDDLLAQHGIGG